MNTEPYRIFWDDELWLVRRPREAAADPTGEDRRQAASGKTGESEDGGAAAVMQVTDRESPNGENPVSFSFAGTETFGKKKLPAASFRQTDPETETARSPAGTGTERPGYGQAAAAYAPVADPFPAIQKPADPTLRRNVPGYGLQSETSSGPQQNDNDRCFSRLSEESRREIRETVNERLSELRVYVLESDITEAQQAVKSVVEQASF